MEAKYLYFYIIPFAGFLADIAILIVLYFSKERRQSRFSLSIFYTGIAGWNLFLFFTYLSHIQEEAMKSLYYFYGFQLLMTNSFLLFCLEQSKVPLPKIEKIIKISLGFTAIWFLLLNYSYLFSKENNLFIKGVQKFDWGFYPNAGYGSYITNIYWLFVFIISLYYLFLYIKNHTEDKRTKIITFLFLLMILASITNFVALWGFKTLPIGNAADAILSTILAAIFFREQYLENKAKLFLKIAGIISAIAVTLVVIWLISDLIISFYKNKLLFFLIAVITSFFSLLFFNILFSPPIPAGSFEKFYEKLRKDYQLTHQEAMICRYILENKDRKEILNILNISGNTLKVQLGSIYKKTIEKNNNNNKELNRNKFPVLKQFLEEVANKIK
jgi:DNA-binding CsgD family transcriptional regulator